MFTSVSRDSPFTTVTGLQAGQLMDQGSVLGRGKRFLFSPVSRARPAFCPVDTGHTFLGDKMGRK
jgi:hypothetical protein